jgi:hypothetical protein
MHENTNTNASISYVLQTCPVGIDGLQQLSMVRKFPTSEKQWNHLEAFVIASRHCDKIVGKGREVGNTPGSPRVKIYSAWERAEGKGTKTRRRLH